MPYQRARKFARAPRWLWNIAQWCWTKRLVRLDLDKETERFKQYWTECFASPRTKIKDGKELNAPGHWRLLTFLLATMGMHMTDALDTPVRVAHCLWACYWEMNGAVDLYYAGRRHELLVALARRQEEYERSASLGA